MPPNAKNRSFLERKISIDSWNEYSLPDLQKGFKKELRPVINDEDYYFEVMYRYINPELSEAYPQPVHRSNLMIGINYFRLRRECQAECDKINRSITNL